MTAEQRRLPVRMTANGRLVIPASYRKALGLHSGGMVVLSLKDGEIQIRPIAAVLAEAQAMVAPYVKSSGDTVDRFIADRHAGAACEELEYQQPEEQKRRSV